MKQADGTLDEALANETGEGRFQVAISSGGAHFFADEPVASGGLGSGPTPYQLLASALAACTTMTLRLYAERKNLPVHNICTAVGHHREMSPSPTDVFVRRISFHGDIDAEQRKRLLEIADRCPVHQTLMAGSRVETELGGALPISPPAAAHMVDMEALIAVGRRSFDFTE